jgi:DNA polymerase bacteriophage-type
VPDPATRNVFVWSDWSNIEARILPWLAGDEEGALARLQIFRDVDAHPKDPAYPDLYTRTAAKLSGIPIAQVTEMIRQRGKVAELALGFGGGYNALISMGANYGLFLLEPEAKAIVERWRLDNPWCVKFWGRHTDEISVGLWGAAMTAMDRPGEPQRAGRIHYVYLGGYLGGSLLAVLPSHRILTYRDVRVDDVDELDDFGNKVGTTRRLRFTRAHSRTTLWHGLLCENVVQAVAADCLRGTLRRLEDAGANVRLHVHDEIVVECAFSEAKATAERLREIMRRGFSWSEGLPLMSEETSAYYYTKSKKDHGI